MLQARSSAPGLAMPAEAVELVREDGHYAIALADGSDVNGRTVIVATGAQLPPARRSPDLERFEGVGVYYAATLIEAQMCAGDPVAGRRRRQLGRPGGDLPLRHAAGCRLLIRGGDLGKSMSRYLVDQIERREKIEVLTHSEVGELHGETASRPRWSTTTAPASPRRAAGRPSSSSSAPTPHTEWLDGRVAMDDDGFLLTGGAVEGADLLLPLDVRRADSPSAAAASQGGGG